MILINKLGPPRMIFFLTDAKTSSHCDERKSSE
jgi:hypothetical protein